MKKTLLSASALLLVCTSCSSISKRNQEAETPQETDAQKIERLQSQNQELSKSLSAISSKLELVETKLVSMSEKIESSTRRMDTMVDNQRAKPGPVKTVPTESAAPLPPAGDDEAESAFTSNEAVRKYRQAMILLQSHNYSDASLGFSAFVDQYPDHALAGSAQYYLGESYFKQKEYKLAARELGRVITTYDRSPHIAETLRDLSISEEKIGQKEEAMRHRQLLTSLFPHSPAAHSSNDAEATNEDHAAPQKAPDPAPTPASATEATTATAAAPAPATAPAIDAPPPTAPMAPSGSAEHETQ